jgi:hypothetical protein
MVKELPVNPVQITETERPVPSGRPANPRAEVWQLLRDAEKERRTTRDECSDRVTAEHDRFTKLLVDVVNVHHQVQVFLQHKRLRLGAAGLEAEVGLLDAIDTQLGVVARRAGAGVMGLTVLDGQRYDIDTMEPFVDVIAAVPTAGVDAPCVSETATPGIWLGVDLLQRARVVLAVPPTEDLLGSDGHRTRKDNARGDP